tara:strand:- start:4594 stop:5430 length:837 start_codon:yes stop_codon:yes gene_type:complete
LIKSKFYILLVLVFISCNNFNDDKSQNIAKYNNQILKKSQLLGLVEDGNKEDSVIVINKFINEWAVNKILIEKAKLNLTIQDLSSLDKLVENYKSELYSTTYLDALINSSINLEIDTTEIENLYNKNIDLFKLKDNIYKLVYVKIPKDFSDIAEVRNKVRNLKNHQKFLDSISYRFSDYSLDTKGWINESDLKKIFSFLNKQKLNSLKNYSFLQSKDSLNLYLIKVLELKTIGSYAPLDYVFPTLEYMSINQRKKKLTQLIKTDLIKNAIQNNELEIF